MKHTTKNKKNKSIKKTLKKTFNSNDYKSGEGMLTSVWGPSMWHSLHTISFNYPVKPTLKDKRNYMKFIKQLRYVLPCKYCRINLRKNFKKLPLTFKNMESRETFSKYIFNLHELINTMLGKKSGLTYSMVRDRYENFRSRCDKKIDDIIENISNGIIREKGCTEPYHGKKSKCIIKIVPQEQKEKTFQMDKRCIKKRLNKTKKNKTHKNKK